MIYQYKVLGLRKMDFNTDAGEHVTGLQLWVQTASADPAWIGGREVFKVWLAADAPLYAVALGLRPGMDITGDCDRKGRPLSIEICG